MHDCDVPSPIDLCNPRDAFEWEKTAQSRLGRTEMFLEFSAQLGRIGGTRPNVLELGSGPGFLASFLLESRPHLKLTLLDFSSAMHELAKVRLGERAAHVNFVHRSFKEPNWMEGLDQFDAVVTNQAVHELRHKRYAKVLHSQVLGVLRQKAPYLVCDHYCGEGGMSNNQLYMSLDEHRQSLLDAGFKHVVQIQRVGSLVMHRAA